MEATEPRSRGGRGGGCALIRRKLATVFLGAEPPGANLNEPRVAAVRTSRGSIRRPAKQHINGALPTNAFKHSISLIRVIQRCGSPEMTCVDFGDGAQ